LFSVEGKPMKAQCSPITHGRSSAVTEQAEGSRRTREGRIVELDILRGMAILLVIGHHKVIEPKDAGIFAPLASLWVSFGWTGVDLFFVLSGFLIGGLLFKELRTKGQLKVGRFIIRRGLKIWPSYFVYLAFVALYLLYRTHGQIAVVAHQMYPSLLHIQNYLWAARDHLWTLSVEEHFYLALPLLLLFLSRKNHGTLPALSIAGTALFLAAFCLFLRCLYLGKPYSPHPYNYTHCRIDSLFWGVLLAYMYQYHPDCPANRLVARNRIAAALIGGLLVMPMMFINWEHPFVWTIGYTFLYVGYGLILLACVNGSVAKDCRHPLIRWPVAALAFIGFYSYTIYLWHLDAGRYRLESLLLKGFLAGLPDSLRWAIVMLLYVGFSVLAGVIASRLVERPVLALRDKLFPARSQIVGSVSSKAPVELEKDPAEEGKADLAVSLSRPFASRVLSPQPGAAAKMDAGK
jgi:peptidoglycan/LPS O-acetylase OafA/YrhL